MSIENQSLNTTPGRPAGIVEKIAAPVREPPGTEPTLAVELNGPPGPEPTRYGDWERKGRCIDF